MCTQPTRRNSRFHPIHEVASLLSLQIYWEPELVHQHRYEHRHGSHLITRHANKVSEEGVCWQLLQCCWRSCIYFLHVCHRSSLGTPPSPTCLNASMHCREAMGLQWAALEPEAHALLPASIMTRCMYMCMQTCLQIWDILQTCYVDQSETAANSFLHLNRKVHIADCQWGMCVPSSSDQLELPMSVSYSRLHIKLACACLIQLEACSHTHARRLVMHPEEAMHMCKGTKLPQ